MINIFICTETFRNVTFIGYPTKHYEINFVLCLSAYIFNIPMNDFRIGDLILSH